MEGKKDFSKTVEKKKIEYSIKYTKDIYRIKLEILNKSNNAFYSADLVIKDLLTQELSLNPQTRQSNWHYFVDLDSVAELIEDTLESESNFEFHSFDNKLHFIIQTKILVGERREIKIQLILELIQQNLDVFSRLKELTNKGDNTKTIFESHMNEYLKDKSLIFDEIESLKKQLKESNENLNKHIVQIYQIQEQQLKEISNVKHDVKSNKDEVVKQLNDTIKKKDEIKKRQSEQKQIEINNIKGQLAEVEKLKEDLNKVYQNSNQLQQELKQQKQAITVIKNETSTVNNDYRQDLDQIKNNFSNLKQEFGDNFKQELSKLSNAKNTQKQEINGIKQELQELSGYKQEMPRLLNEMSGIRQDLSELGKIKQKLADYAVGNKQDFGKFKEEMNNQKQVIETMRQEMTDINSLINALNEQKQILAKVADEVGKHCEDLHEKKDEISQQKQDLFLLQKNLTTSISTLKEDNQNSMKIMNDSLLLFQRDLDDINKTFTSKLIEIQKETGEKNVTVDTNEIKQELNKQKQEINQFKQKNKQELSWVKEENEAIKEEIDRLKEEAANLKQESNKISKELSIVTLKDEGKKDSSLFQELNQLKREFLQYKQEVANLIEKIKQDNKASSNQMGENLIRIINEKIVPLTKKIHEKSENKDGRSDDDNDNDDGKVKKARSNFRRDLMDEAQNDRMTVARSQNRMGTGKMELEVSPVKINFCDDIDKDRNHVHKTSDKNIKENNSYNFNEEKPTKDRNNIYVQKIEKNENNMNNIGLNLIEGRETKATRAKGGIPLLNENNLNHSKNQMKSFTPSMSDDSYFNKITFYNANNPNLLISNNNKTVRKVSSGWNGIRAGEKIGSKGVQKYSFQVNKTTSYYILAGFGIGNVEKNQNYSYCHNNTKSWMVSFYSGALYQNEAKDGFFTNQSIKPAVNRDVMTIAIDLDNDLMFVEMNGEMIGDKKRIKIKKDLKDQLYPVFDLTHNDDQITLF